MFLHFNLRTMIAAVVALLVGYWAVHVPDLAPTSRDLPSRAIQSAKVDHLSAMASGR
jgi:hypothetical protein